MKYFVLGWTASQYHTEPSVNLTSVESQFSALEISRNFTKPKDRRMNF